MTEQYTPGYDETDSVGADNVVSLGRGPVPEPTPTGGGRSQSRLHRIAIASMTICAVIGTLSMLAFITVSWPGQSGRYMVGALIAATVGFMASASIAVFSAAKDTYAHPASSGEMSGEKKDDAPSDI